MKRIIFYAHVIIIASCFTGVFAMLFWFLTSTIMKKSFESEFSIFRMVMFTSLYVPLFLFLAVVILFAAGFFIHRANIHYKMRSRSFTLLRPGVTEGRKESIFSPASHFAGGLSGSGSLIPGPGMPFTNYGGPLPFGQKQNYIPFARQSKNPSYGKGPAGNKPHLVLLKGGRESPGDLPKDSRGARSPGFPSGKDNTIRPFPVKRNNRRKR
ncbi:MAG: hypothetical protein LBF77_10070 [Spirochaetaceae bacterium]|jgi:hypothetical protein|nr:hypothetical protein [Spirochaetaceae bacterium]